MAKTSAQRQKEYRQRHPERTKLCYQRNRDKCRTKNVASTKRWRDRVKTEVIAAYGGPACSNPSCIHHFHPDAAVACIDHVNDDGAIDREKLPGWKFYLDLHRKLRAGHLRDDLQILCFNCNRKKVNYGPCFMAWPGAMSELCQRMNEAQVA